MSADFLAMGAGVVVSLGFSYIPGLNEKFAALEAVYKRLVMLVVLLFVALLVIGVSCAGFAVDFGIQAVCDRAGIVAVVQAFFMAAIANQAAYSLTKPS